MKRLFKKMISIMALLIVSTTVLTCLYGCTGKNSNRFDTDLFCCMYSEDKTGVIILELTEKGQEQEILVIPEEINGLPVVQLGGTTVGYPYQNNHFLKSNIIKKMYVGENVSFGNDEIIMDNLSEIIIYPSIVYSNSFRSTFVSEKINVFVRKGIIGTGFLENHGYHPSYNDVFKEANVTFYSDTDEICFIDNYNSSNLYINPITPKKDGFVFTGWYLEEDCINKWNGQYPETGKLNIYIKWEQ